MSEFLTLKVLLNPSSESRTILWSLSKIFTKLYNIALEQKILNQKKAYLKYEKQVKELKKLKKEFPEFNLLYSKVIQNILRKLDDNFKFFFSNRKNGNSPRPPFFKSSKHFFTLRYDQSGFSIDFKNKILMDVNSAINFLRLTYCLVARPGVKIRGMFLISVVLDNKLIRKFHP